MLLKEDVMELSRVPKHERTKLLKRLREHWGAIKTIGQRCDPPINRATVTLWFQGRVQSSRLDDQIPREAERYLREKA